MGSRRNLTLIPVHQGLASAYVWLPVIVLFTRSRFGLGQALVLSALYYLSVVVLEVPSGWMSDRLGRVVTLRVAAASWVVAQACLLVGDDSFPLIVAGQFFLAGGFASLSGTDVTFHYDTLESLGRAIEYPARQARISAIGYSVTAVSALVGGGVAYLSLRAVFAVALVLALAQLALTFALAEPGSGVESGDAGAAAVQGSDGAGRRAVSAGGAVAAGGGDQADGASAAGVETGRPTAESALVPQLRRCLAYLRTPYLAWIFGYGVAMVTLEHVAVSVLQPWLTELTGGTATDIGATPLLSGAVSAGIAVLGAGAARSSDPLARRFGTIPTLLGLGVLSAVIVTTMAAWFHPIVLALVAFRGVQGAAAPVLISDAVASRVERQHRATLLSLDSLAGRLVWGSILLTIGSGGGDDVRRTLIVLAVVAWSMVVVTVGGAAALGRPSWRIGRAAARPMPEPG